MIVAHLDLDAFYAAVEELENPELRTKPLIVGGDPHGRGVVATANYEARKFGIHSAMSCAEALRRCPHAVFVRPRHSLYREYSQHVWETVRGVVPTVERTGLDEGYLDVGEVAADFLAARKVAEAVQTAVRAATSLTCSLGVSTSKVVAKIASDHRKPGGLVVVPAGSEASLPRAVRRCGGCRASGRRRSSVSSPAASRRSARSHELGDRELRRLLPGSVGRVLRDRARGIDPRGLELQTARISISVENTFERDLTDRAQLHAELRRMAERGRRTSAEDRPDRSHGLDEGALSRLRDPQPVDVAARRHRRRRADRRARVRPARPRARRPPRCATSRRRRRLGAREPSPARARLIHRCLRRSGAGIPRSSDASGSDRSTLARQAVLAPPLEGIAIERVGGPLPRLEAEKTRPEREPNHAPPGQFISDEHEADCSRFLEEVKEFVQRRREAGLGRER